nr:acetylajmalan esterase-like [Ipomoea batatas]
MASSSFFFVACLLLLPFAYANNINTTTIKNTPSLCPFKSIYQFGDSFADTGNFLRISGVSTSFHADRHPYGRTYFRKPTGRFSDGRLIVDYIAFALKLPFIAPYLDNSASFVHGVNFAVAGATALDNSFFSQRHINAPAYNVPMSAQLKWYHAHLNATCHTSSACAGKVKNALFIFGEFGHDDYYNALAQRKSVHDTRAYVPYAVDAVINGVRDIVKSGAKRVIVPGTIPFGCLPVYLTAFRSSDPKAYDDLGCLKSLNDLSSYHNTYLKKALSLLSKELPSDAVVVYGDYYGAFRSVLRQASSLGFDSGSLLKACCGAGGVYNFDAKKMCGSGNVPVCSNPARSINWDGFHPTDETNHRMSEILIDQVLRKITCG